MPDSEGRITFDDIKEAEARLKVANPLPNISAEEFRRLYLSVVPQTPNPFFSETAKKMRAWRPDYTTPDLWVIDDEIPEPSQSKKETHMLFKFVTTKPDAVTLWNTISKTPMPTQGGWTDYQLRFLIFCAFQLNEFTVVKEGVNKYLDSPTARTLSLLESLIRTHIDPKLISNLSQPLADLPLVVDRDLHILFYYCMQIGLDVAVIEQLLEVGFNTEEAEYIRLGSSTDPLNSNRLSLYKLSVFTNLPIQHYSDLFRIDELLPPVEIESKEELISHLKYRIFDLLTLAWEEDGILVLDFEQFKLTIPPFQLKESK